MPMLFHQEGGDVAQALAVEALGEPAEASSKFTRSELRVRA
jgi:hypothetical protein